MIVFNIKKIRKEKNISLYKLEKMTHLSRAYLSRLEKNMKINPSMNTLLRIANALNVNVKDLFYTTFDLDSLKEEMYKRIDTYGIDSKEIFELSQLIDLLINIDMNEKKN